MSKEQLNLAIGAEATAFNTASSELDKLSVNILDCTGIELLMSRMGMYNQSFTEYYVKQNILVDKPNLLVTEITGYDPYVEFEVTDLMEQFLRVVVVNNKVSGVILQSCAWDYTGDMLYRYSKQKGNTDKQEDWRELIKEICTKTCCRNWREFVSEKYTVNLDGKPVKIYSCGIDDIMIGFSIDESQYNYFKINNTCEKLIIHVDYEEYVLDMDNMLNSTTKFLTKLFNKYSYLTSQYEDEHQLALDNFKEDSPYRYIEYNAPTLFGKRSKDTHVKFHLTNHKYGKDYIEFDYGCKLFLDKSKGIYAIAIGWDNQLTHNYVEIEYKQGLRSNIVTAITDSTFDSNVEVYTSCPDHLDIDMTGYKYLIEFID